MRLGQPRRPEIYDRWEIDGIDLYVPRGFEPLNLVTVDLKNLLGFKMLELDGWKLI